MYSEELINSHNVYRTHMLNMQASENYLSQTVRNALSSDMASRYSMVFDTTVHGEFVHNAYGGAKYEEKIRVFAESLAREIFNFEYASVKPISGHAAAMAVVISLTKRGDRIMTISPEDGGYDGYSYGYLPDMLGLHYKPIKTESHHILNVDDIYNFKPELIIVGASYVLFPYNLGDVITAAADVGAKVVYDASHILGLIPYGFQKDIDKCDVVYGSTHKSYPGPQGGIILSNDEYVLRKIENNLTWKVQDNYHANRVAALCVSMEEFRSVAKDYGKAVQENSHALGTSLYSKSFPLMYPPDFTKSHQLLIDVLKLHNDFKLSPAKISVILEQNGIIIDRVGRIGTAELTWKGYNPAHMRKIAALITFALSGEDVSKEVEEIVNLWDGETMGMKK